MTMTVLDPPASTGMARPDDGTETDDAALVTFYDLNLTRVAERIITVTIRPDGEGGHLVRPVEPIELRTPGDFYPDPKPVPGTTGIEGWPLVWFQIDYTWRGSPHQTDITALCPDRQRRATEVWVHNGGRCTIVWPEL